MSEDNNKKELEILWTPQNVAKYLGLNPVTVYRWIAEKRMFDPNKIVRFSNRVRIPRSEVERIAALTFDFISGETRYAFDFTTGDSYTI